ncbi:helix-turn-helix domain-containing protein [Chondromyces crocatus]|uniref:helix-turn-helix domain-containing protein n=1 Tax=Chondromyces crocatus TaxID=52 RepID=UPI0012E22F5B|nr:helix-turn-helix transcriptional regulator [Chondromyces crocatus]
MDASDIKALRQELACTARELAAALDIEQDVVLSWERGELFPTKRHVTQMEALRSQGPSAIPRRPKGRRSPQQPPLHLLAEPELWRLVRKLLAHAELRAEAMKLAEQYPDPAEDLPEKGR